MGCFHLSLCLVLVFGVCSAQLDGHISQRQGPRFRTKCQIQNLNATRPTLAIRSEAGLTESWDQNDQQFLCAGVAARRHSINPRGLFLPLLNNAHTLFYVVQGRGIQGTVFPGCPESQSERGRQQSQNDDSQTIRRIMQGDVIAIQVSTAHWMYNDGESEMVVVSVGDVANAAANQLDLNLRQFFLGGNFAINLLGVAAAFDANLLQGAFSVDINLARILQSQNDNRGAIVNVQGQFEVLSRQSEEEEEPEKEGNSDGLDETFCTMKLTHQIDNPSLADIFNPRGGRITTVNSHKLPILRSLQLSAERGVLYKNAFFAPHWNVNAHSIVYITRGDGTIQVVRDNGVSVFDDRVEEGQMIVVPQNFAVLKKAGDQGLEWIAFKTNANAMINALAGRGSVFRALPVDVLVNMYRVSREDARRLKEIRRHEMYVFSPN